MSGTMSGRNPKIISKNMDVQGLLMTAFGHNQSRCVFPAGLPAERFDLLCTLPEGYQQKLQADLRSRFGLVAHTEERLADVWLLQVNTPHAPGLKMSPDNRNGYWTSSAYDVKILGHQVSDCLGWLEGALGRPVIDQTGLTGRYDLDLNWKPKPGQSEKEALRQAMLEQLGLGLVSTNLPIEMLVVDKVK